MKITRQRLTNMASQCGKRDFDSFADRIAELNPILGIIIEMHADAADGNSPDVEEWVELAMHEQVAVSEMDIDAAEEYFSRTYGDDR